MLGKIVFKRGSTSYSQFLQSEKHAHSFHSPNSSVDIEIFRRSISLHYQHVYATQKWQNWIYRFIFFGFGLLFLALGSIIFFKTTNYVCSFYFSNNCVAIKNGINFFCLLLATCAFVFGYKIQPEREAIRYLVGKVAKEFSTPAKQLQIEFNAIFDNLSNNWLTPSPHTTWIKKVIGKRS